MSETVIITNRQGKRIVGDLHLPAEKQDKYPLVLVVHGFKGHKDQGWTTEAAQRLSEEGVAAYRFDLTNGIGESDGDLVNITMTGNIEDIEDVLGYFQKQDFVDESRIGLAGHSLGAMEILISAGKRNDIKTIVAMSSATNEDLGKRKEKELQEIEEKGYFKVFSRSKDKWYKVGKQFLEDRMGLDFLGFVKGIKCPTLVLHGKGDETCDFAGARKTFESLCCEKDFIELPEEIPHTYRQPEHIRAAVGPMVEWMKKYLVNNE